MRLRSLRDSVRGFFVFLIFLWISPELSLSEIYDSGASSSAGYTCRTDNDCLDYLRHNLLNKESAESIYEVCGEVRKRIKDCCINPLQCNESYSEDLVQSLRANSLNIVQQAVSNFSSCPLPRISNLVNSLSSVQKDICNTGIENCKISCENKLKELVHDNLSSS